MEGQGPVLTATSSLALAQWDSLTDLGPGAVLGRPWVQTPVHFSRKVINFWLAEGLFPLIGRTWSVFADSWALRRSYQALWLQHKKHLFIPTPLRHMSCFQSVKGHPPSSLPPLIPPSSCLYSRPHFSLGPLYQPLSGLPAFPLGPSY